MTDKTNVEDVNTNIDSTYMDAMNHILKSIKRSDNSINTLHLTQAALNLANAMCSHVSGVAESNC